MRYNIYRYWPASAVINRSIFRSETDTNCNIVNYILNNDQYIPGYK